LLYWVARREVLPSEMVLALEDSIGTEFDFEMSIEPNRVFRMVVYLEDSSRLDGEQLQLLPARDDPNFVHDECRAWRLTCCESALRMDWAFWRNSIGYGSGSDGTEDWSEDEGDDGEGRGVLISGGRTEGTSLVEDLDALVEKVQKQLEDDKSQGNKRRVSQM